MIKRSAIIGVICFWTVLAAKAQIIETTPYRFLFGASAGTTFSSVTFNPKVTQGSLNGLTFGVTGRMDMGKNVGLQIEFNYVQQGWKEKYEEYPDLYYSRTLNYLQMPFLTRVQFGGKNVKFFINAGPQIGLLTGESTKENLNGIIPWRVYGQHDMPAETNFEWGLCGGPGLEIRSKIGIFTIEGRYFYSFGDIYPTRRRDYFAKASSQVTTAKIGYLIPF